MTSFILRPARAEDIPVLGAIERAADERFRETAHASFLDGETIPLDVAKRAVEAGRITVAEVDGEVVGWLLVTRLGAELCLGQVSVLPSHGRLGIGTALLRDSIARARAAGERTLVLNTQSDVAWNMPWYARHGFVVVPPEEWSPEMRVVTEAQREHGIDWHSRVHMRLVLA
ncbi:GNAT family N-acetyltransferase [Polyangium jinanense]|uniref:GNAT family N-acetyltransferase n=1 Tax=Polyangium jinanense TaxID=2829994 RepID=A0A9X4AX58_9BACT|nr:GNAT family N-acetyltransferase [Polyangium jinanense]MDC3958901.1 GNAT family N-acetyltransferase [Polyangium jinanense]MDC3986015.1 GNAT family N-acetyltransferase [Polyangium jinanense]